MKKQVGLLLGLLTLSVGLSGANPIVIADEATHSHDTPVALLKQDSLLGTLVTKSSTADEKQTDRGIGYYWKFHTCGYHSKWHLFPGTAVSAANKHAQQYDHVTSVYPN
ncbi:hypothetical protein [Candidatus Enterococcus mangumiae]|uniref:Lactococcin 972 family bacteriocin n=1 Tax=Candidatus Enterococcus mangumiae TaxID=2230878 RepID=A0ABZ2T1F9_9ENTE|nr:hypothetical protein [Enterococcus sp. DIV1094]MBO0489802.1 hypothetical protein [Enterococcus sp. DIV1094]